MTNVFEQIRNKWHDSPYVIYIFGLALALFFSGIVLFMEDAKSSRRRDDDSDKKSDDKSDSKSDDSSDNDNDRDSDD